MLKSTQFLPIQTEEKLRNSNNLFANNNDNELSQILNTKPSPSELPNRPRPSFSGQKETKSVLKRQQINTQPPPPLPSLPSPPINEMLMEEPYLLNVNVRYGELLPHQEQLIRDIKSSSNRKQMEEEFAMLKDGKPVKEYLQEKLSSSMKTHPRIKESIINGFIELRKKGYDPDIDKYLKMLYTKFETPRGAYTVYNIYIQLMNALYNLRKDDIRRNTKTKTIKKVGESKIKNSWNTYKMLNRRRNLDKIKNYNIFQKELNKYNNEAYKLFMPILKSLISDNEDERNLIKYINDGINDKKQVINAIYLITRIDKLDYKIQDSYNKYAKYSLFSFDHVYNGNKIIFALDLMKNVIINLEILIKQNDLEKLKKKIEEKGRMDEKNQQNMNKLTYNLIKKLENTRSLKLKMIPNNISEQLLENVDQYEPKKSFFGKLRNKITRKTSSNVFGTKQAQGKMSSSNQSTNKPEQYPTNTKKQGASSLRRMVLGDAAVNLGTGMPATEMQNTTRTQPIHNPVYEGL